MSLNNYATVYCPRRVWIHSSHAIFIPLLSLTLNFLISATDDLSPFPRSIWYLWAHFLHHLVAEAILYCIKYTDITYKRIFHSYYNKVRASKQVSLFLPSSGILEHLLLLTHTWHLFIQLSIHHPLICRSLWSNCTRIGRESKVQVSIIILSFVVPASTCTSQTSCYNGIFWVKDWASLYHYMYLSTGNIVDTQQIFLKNRSWLPPIFSHPG